MKKSRPAPLLRPLLYREGGDAGTSPADPLPRERTHGEDWDDLEDLLRLHGIAPYLYSLLAGEGSLDTLPPAFRERLREMHRSSSVEHFALLAEFRHLAGAFSGKGIRAVPLKGAALFTTLYEEPGLRPMQDMDWLIDSADLPAGEEIMLELGYTIPAALRVEAVRRTHFHLPYVSRNGRFRVELHWNLADETIFPKAKAEALWKRVQILPGGETPRLDAVSEFLYLALHAYKHGFLNSTLARRRDCLPLVYDPLSGNRLVWLLDLWKLMGSPAGPEPGEVFSLAGEWELEEALCTSLILAQYVFGPAAGWNGRLSQDLPGERGIKGLVHDRLAAGLLRRSPFFVALAERLQRLDHARDVRLVRALDLLDLLTPTPGEVRLWRSRAGGLFLPFLYPYRLISGTAAAGYRAMRFLLGR
jgi:hypothetical protein